MRKFLIVSILAMLNFGLAQTVWAGDGDVESSVTSSGGVTYFEEEDHPMKMDWSNWTFCWGANDKSKTYNQDAEQQKAEGENHGSLDNFTPVDGPLARMLVNRVQWDNQFDKREMVFNVNIKRQIGASQHRSEDSTCTTHSWDYKVNKASLKATTSVELRVPTGVWVMRIKTLINRGGYRPVISRARALPANTNAKVEESKDFVLDGYQYFFTRPGEDFKISLDIDDRQVHDIELVASFEVRFAGQNNCEEAIRDVLGNQPLMTSTDLSGRVTTALSQIENGLSAESDKSGVENLHRATLFIGCLMNRDVADGLLYNNDSGQIYNLMNSVESFQTRVSEKQIHVDAYKSVGDAMKLLTQMSLASLQANVLDSVKPYCERLPLFDRSTGQRIGFERGFLKIARNLKQVRSLLGDNGFSNYFARLLQTYQTSLIGRGTYAQIASTPKTQAELVQLMNLFEANNKVLVAHRISGLLAELPQLRLTATVVALAQGAQQIEMLTTRIHNGLAREFDHFIARSKGTPNIEAMGTDIRALAAAESKLRDNALKLLQLIDNEEGTFVTSRFTTSIEKIIQSGSNGWLNHVYNGYFSEFLEGIDPDFKVQREAGAIDEDGNYKRQALTEVQECLIGISSNAK